MKIDIAFLTSMVLLAFSNVGAAGADTITLDADSVQTIAPQVVTALDHADLPAAIKTQFKFTPDRSENGGVLGEDQAAEYRKIFTAPQMRYSSVDVFIPGGAHTPGLKYVEGYDTVWRPKGNGEFTRHDEIRWRWEPPADLQKTWYAWAHPRNRDHFAAVALYPTKWEDTDLTLLYFDANSGLKWQQQAPLAATLQQAMTQLPALPYPFAGGGDIGSNQYSVLSTVTQDGARVLVMARRPQEKISVLYIYDGEGELKHTIILPMLYINKIDRTRNGNVFIVGGSRTVAVASASGNQAYKNVSEYYLMDAEGHFLGHFVDEKGESFSGYGIQEISEDNKYAYGKRGSQGFIYSVAKLLGTAAPSGQEGPSGQ